MKKQLVLHIGSEKTATTYLQRLLSSQRQNIENQGVLYPKIGFNEQAHFSLVAALHDLDHSQSLEFVPPGVKCTIESEWLPLLEMLTRQTDYHTVVLSAEHFSSRLGPNALYKLQSLLSALTDYSIKILYYVRRQDDFFESWYSTYIKAGGKESLTASFNKLKNNRSILDFHYIISNWIKAFPNAEYSVRSYDLDLQEGRFVSEFSKEINCNFNLTEQDFNKENKSWGPEMLSFARIVNMEYSSTLGANRYTVLNQISESGIFDKNNSCQHILNKKERRELVDNYRESNEKLKPLGFPYEQTNYRVDEAESCSPDEVQHSVHSLVNALINLSLYCRPPKEQAAELNKTQVRQ
ncbi:hypothetical protein IC617_10160 [Neiella sp. HB171785]|uniref:Sulfotransferase domain-containing protein n=1 Tax=Neiella litorisoli TaxID=2771431 RepID=A0A8J6UM30_9GAMM|nr:hypothetical protein [Neiella litorisoli]MBD1389790.1 hypothetical protein [Neiella litorisoli]